MVACTAGTVIVLGHMVIGATIMAIGADAASTVRKQTFSVHVAANGNIDISYGLNDSMLEPLSGHERNGGVGTRGNFETGADNGDKLVALDKSSLVRQHTFPVQVARDEDIQISDGVDNLKHKQTFSLVRNMGVDAKSSLETETDVRTSPTLTDKRDSAITVLQDCIGHIRSSVHLSLAFICLLFTVVGCLAMAFVAKDDLSNLARAIGLRQAFRKGRESTSVCSDGESGSSSEESMQIQFETERSFHWQSVVTKGVFWKLRHRYSDDLMSHQGTNFEPVDRFAFLENWDLRFFYLNVKDGAVHLSYISELNDLSSVVFDVESIDVNIRDIPALQAEVPREKKARKGALIKLYKNYLENLRQLGVRFTEISTRDPERLFVFSVTGIKKPRGTSSQKMGRRISWSNSATGEESAKLVRMCLGTNNSKDCKRWHAEISNLLAQKKGGGNTLRKSMADAYQRFRGEVAGSG